MTPQPLSQPNVSQVPSEQASGGPAERERPGILYVLPWELTAVGGVSQVVANLIRQAAASGALRPILLETRSEYPRPSAIATQALTTIKLCVLSPFDGRRSPRALVSFAWNLWRTLSHLRGVLSRYGVTTVNVHYPSLAALHFCLLRTLRIWRGKVILSFHGLDIRGAVQSKGIERFLWRRLLQCADSIVACSRALAEEIGAFEPAVLPRLVTIHNGVDRAAIEAQRERDFVVPELAAAPYLLSVGTFEHKKGHDVLLQAFQLLAGDFPRLRLVLVGRSGDFLTTLRREAQRLGIEDRVLFFRDVPHERIAAFFEGATVFCLPSRAEPFGIVLLEAALFGVPVVASDVGGVREVMRRDVDGLLVKPDDPQGLAEAIRALLTNEDLRARHARSFAGRAAEQFTWTKSFARYLELV